MSTLNDGSVVTRNDARQQSSASLSGCQSVVVNKVEKQEEGEEDGAAEEEQSSISSNNEGAGNDHDERGRRAG